MRTTLTLDDEALRAARSLARNRSISLGAAVSELVHKGLSREAEMDEEDGIPVFRVRPGARTITLEDVKSMEDEA